MNKILRDGLDFRPVELAFGTSGLRGRVADLSQLEVAINTLGFLQFLAERGVIREGDEVWVAGDLRPSTSRGVVLDGLPRGEMLQAVCWAIIRAGYKPGYLGLIPSPALMAFGLRRRQASVMVTGSHIPFDRNGIKFNKPDGEVLKSDEADILRCVGEVRCGVLGQLAADSPFGSDGQLKPGECSGLPSVNSLGGEEYLRRYTDAFPAGVLRGRRLLVYQHSAVGRDLVVTLLQRLGADVVVAGRSDQFIPVDTEAVMPAMLEAIQKLVDANGGASIDAVVSTDGDSDRPLLLGIEDGQVRFCGGDLLGIVVADFLGAGHVAVPISSNDAVDRFFASRGVEVEKTRIGSPYVIAAMKDVGWEANGGFLTARRFSVAGGGDLEALPTRDAVLPLLAALYASLGRGMRVVDCFAALPRRYGRADVIREFPRETSLRILEAFVPEDRSIEEVRFSGQRIEVRSAGSLEVREATPGEAEDVCRKRAALGRAFGPLFGEADIAWINACDGCRFGSSRGEILHLRPSGNAPEQRVYALADSAERAVELVEEVVRPGGVIGRLRDELEGAVIRSEEEPDVQPLRLRGVVQHYAWGGTEFIPGLLGLENPDRKPYAELWLGAHPSASSEVEMGGRVWSLRDLLAAESSRQLGPGIMERFGHELPFLFKVLDARDMLSIQVHPDRRQAEEGYGREEAAGVPLTASHRNYRDRNPKPEVHVALTPFWMLLGFRPLEEVVGESRRHPGLSRAWPELERQLPGCTTPEARSALLRSTYERVMRMPQAEVDAILKPVLAREFSTAEPDRSDPMFWVRRASATFARRDGSVDRGLFSLWLLNLVHLEPGQSTFQDAGVPHAYLEGVTVELMAASDNVLRGGLTPKHVDVDELLRVVRFEECHPRVMEGTSAGEREFRYPTPAAEFELSRVSLPAGGEWSGKSTGGPECLLVLEGEVEVKAGGAVLGCLRGQSVWVPWGLHYSLAASPRADAVVFRARVP